MSNRKDLLTRERLHGAADLLEEFGHAKCYFGARGQQMCILGAITQALRDEGLESDEDIVREAEPCIEMLQRRLPDYWKTYSVYTYNDDPRVTTDDVLTLLRGDA